MKLINWLGNIVRDEKGNPSSKRVVGLMCAIALCITMYHNSFSPTETAPSTALVDAVALLAFGCLGLSSVDKIWSKKQSNETTEK